MIHDENEFLLLRRQLLNQNSMHEHRRAARIAQTMDYEAIPVNIDPLVKAKLLKRRDRAKSVILHYTHEQRFAHYKRAIHRMWNDTFHNTHLQAATLIVGTRNNPNLEKELVRRNPFPKKKPTTIPRPTAN
jgi:hypothetical protein